MRPFPSALPQAAEGLAESTEEAAKALGNRAMEYVAAGARAVGLEPERKRTSADVIYGAVSKMQCPPAGGIGG